MELTLQVLQLCGAVVGIGLEILIISALLRTGVKRYPVLFAYTVVNFLTTVIETKLTIQVYRHDRYARYLYEWYYWRDEALLHFLVLAVVINLIYFSAGTARSRRILLLTLVPGAIAYVAISFFIHYKPSPTNWISGWMTPWMRDVYLLSTILDLTLWAMLIAAKKKNYQLLMLSGALGIQFTGEAIGQSFRALSTRPRSLGLALTGNIVIMLANLTAMYIWWRAFRSGRGFKEKEPPVAGRP